MNNEKNFLRLKKSNFSHRSYFNFLFSDCEHKRLKNIPDVLLKKAFDNCVTIDYHNIEKYLSDRRIKKYNKEKKSLISTFKNNFEEKNPQLNIEVINFEKISYYDNKIIDKYFLTFEYNITSNVLCPNGVINIYYKVLPETKFKFEGMTIYDGFNEKGMHASKSKRIIKQVLNYLPLDKNEIEIIKEDLTIDNMENFIYEFEK